MLQPAGVSARPALIKPVPLNCTLRSPTDCFVKNSRSKSGTGVLGREDGAGEELAVLALVEPRALEIKQWDAGQVREGERIESELGERL